MLILRRHIKVNPKGLLFPGWRLYTPSRDSKAVVGPGYRSPPWQSWVNLVQGHTTGLDYTDWKFHI